MNKEIENIIKKTKEPPTIMPTVTKQPVSKPAEPQKPVPPSMVPQVQPKPETKPEIKPETKPPPVSEGFVKVAISEEESDSEEEEKELPGKVEAPAQPILPAKPESLPSKKVESMWSEEEIKQPTNVAPSVPKIMSEEELEQFFADYNAQKESGKKFHRGGRYDEAIKEYNKAVRVLVELRKSSPEKLEKVPESEFKKREAIAYSNMAVCYKQMQDNSNVIQHATKAIDAAGNDTKLRLKALILRAYAYEGVDKLLNAKEDWTKVKELQYDNMDASKALGRIEEAFKRDKSQRVGEALRSIQKQLEEYKKSGNEFYKSSMLICTKK